jgi:hypothetical protein
VSHRISHILLQSLISVSLAFITPSHRFSQCLCSLQPPKLSHLSYSPFFQNPANSPFSGNTVAACIFFYYGFYNIALSPLLVSYTVEILPFRVRSKGLMIMNLAVNCSLVFNQYANPIALDALKWKYYSKSLPPTQPPRSYVYVLIATVSRLHRLASIRIRFPLLLHH